MENTGLLYEGKAKKIYQTSLENQVLVEYLDQLTALNGKQKDQCQGKGELTNAITSVLFTQLADQNIPTHFIEKTSKTEQLVEKLDMIPLEVVIRNVSAGSFMTRFQLTEPISFQTPIIEYYYKNDRLDDPFINDDHIFHLKLVTKDQLATIRQLALNINQVLVSYFTTLDLDLIDFKLEFGFDTSGNIILGDEISPDTCRLHDVKTSASLDKDLYRKQTGDVLKAYQEVYARINQTKELVHHVSY